MRKLAFLLTVLGALRANAQGTAYLDGQANPCVGVPITYTYIPGSGCGQNFTVAWYIPANPGVDYDMTNGPTQNSKTITWKQGSMDITISADCNGQNVTGSNGADRAVHVGIPVQSDFSPTQGTFCANSETAFTITSFGENSFNHVWTITPSDSAGAGTITVPPPPTAALTATVKWRAGFSGWATVSVTPGAGCYGASLPKSHTFYINPAPANPSLDPLSFCDFEVPTFSGPDPTNFNYTWYAPNGDLIGTAQTQSYKVLEPGTYTFSIAAIKKSSQCVAASKRPFTVAISDQCTDEKLHTIHATAYNYGPSSTTPVIVGESKTYFSIAGEALQSQSRSFSTNQIFTQQSVQDQLGRPVMTSLPAPTNETAFRYKYRFILNTAGARYSYLDLGSPVSTAAGTLGNFYSSASSEPLIAKSGYPFSQVEYYPADIGGVKKSAGVGEILRMGSQHEALMGTFPVFAELADYFQQQALVSSAMNEKGLVQNVTCDQNKRYAIAVQNKAGNVLMTALKAPWQDPSALEVANTVQSSGDPASANYRPITVFYLLDDQPVSISGTGFSVENIVTGERRAQNVTFTGSDGKWAAGFYRIILKATTANVTFSYKNYFSNVAYSFYDQSGALLCSVSPKGVALLRGAHDYANADKTTYRYNFRGQLVEKTTTDGGTARFRYRRDGAIRFSQNAEQALHNRFSYTNYDALGRPVESGEYKGSSVNFATAPLEFADQVDYGTEKQDWVQTFYDMADADFLTSPLHTSYMQTFVRGKVSASKNPNAKTWYSYDEQGRIVWTARKLGMPLYFVTTYSYDFLGNVLQVSDLTYNTSGTQIKQFYHYYTYDKDLRLETVNTSTTTDAEKKLRAKYLYYQHGPLKRLELGNGIQGVDFLYNIAGWLTQINHPVQSLDPHSDPNDAFGMIIDYYESDMPDLLSSNVNPEVNPLKFHGLPENESSYAAGRKPMVKFAPEFPDASETTPWKKFSSDNAEYRKMLLNQKLEN